MLEKRVSCVIGVDLHTLSPEAESSNVGQTLLHLLLHASLVKRFTGLLIFSNLGDLDEVSL